MKRACLVNIILLLFTAACTSSMSKPNSEGDNWPCLRDATYTENGFHSSCSTGFFLMGKDYGTVNFEYGNNVPATRGSCDEYGANGKGEQMGNVGISIEEGMANLKMNSPMGSYGLKPNAGSMDSIWVESYSPGDPGPKSQLVSCPGLDAKVAELLRLSETSEDCGGKKKTDAQMASQMASIMASIQCPELDTYTRSLKFMQDMNKPENQQYLAMAAVLNKEFPEVAFKMGGQNKAAIVPAIVAIAELLKKALDFTQFLIERNDKMKAWNVQKK